MSDLADCFCVFRRRVLHPSNPLSASEIKAGLVYITEISIPSAMKTVFAASALAMVGCTDAFVAPSAARASLSPSSSLDTRSSKSAVRATPSMEFAGGLRGAGGPEPNSKNFDPLGLSEA